MTTAPHPSTPDRDEGPPRAARALVYAALALLCTAGLIGFEAWPMTAWRLFSAERRATQTAWVIEADLADGGARIVDPEELPLEYRHAAWPIAAARRASDEVREDLCQALLEAAQEVEPELIALRLVRDRQTLRKHDGDWRVEHDGETFHTCVAEAGR